jgi:methylated-DNA-[protein]-cysteine S-methyltransferase
MQFNLSTIDSPVGTLLLVTDDQERVRALEFSDHEARLRRLLREHYGPVELVEVTAPSKVVLAMQRYFSGDLAAFDDIVTMTNGTDLQRQVWTALRGIPGGRTISYGELARALGHDDPRMAVDIGAANGANPIAIIVPCHRVIAKNGDLKGYAWGVHRKRWLLEHEGAIAAAQPAIPPQELRLPGF